MTETAPATPSRRLAVLAVLAFLAVLTATELAYRPPHPAPRSASAEEFSADRAFDCLQRILGDGDAPHPLGTDEHAAVRERIVAELESLGLEPEVQTTLVPNRNTVARVHNIVARIDGRQAQSSLLLAAHYDSVAAGPGASDDGAAVAAMLETARAILAGPKPRFPIVLLIDDGEELGLLGARAFCAEHHWAEKVGAVLNFEARGTSGPSLMFETSGDDAWLADFVARTLPQPVTGSAFAAVYRTLPNNTDLTVFREHGIPGLNFAFVGGARRYHTPLDDLAHLDRGSLQHHGDNMLTLARALADSYFLIAPPSGHASFFDLFGAGMVVFPRDLEMRGAGLLLIALAVLLALRAMRGNLQVSKLGLALCVCLAGTSAAAGLGALWSLVAQGTGVLPTPFPPDHMPFVLGYALLGIAVGCAAVGFSAQRLDAWHSAAGLGLYGALLAAAVAVLWPGAGYVALPSAGLGLVLALLGGKDSPRRVQWTTIAGALLGAVTLAPFFVLMPQALGLRAGAAHSAVAAHATLLFAPLLPTLLGGRLKQTALVCGLASLLALVYAQTLPPHDEHHPARANLGYFETAGQKAVLCVHDGELHVGGTVARPLPFEREGLCMPTRPIGAPGPEFVVTANERKITGKKTLRATLRSRRDAPWLSLWLPASISVESAKVAGKKVIAPRSTQSTSWRAIHFLGAEADESIDIELTYTGSGVAFASDRTPGLPADASNLLRRRTAQLAAPIHMGDLTVLATPIKGL